MSAWYDAERVLALADELAIDHLRAHDVFDLGQREEERVFRLVQNARLHQPLGLVEQCPLVHEVPADHAVLRILAIADEGPHPVDHVLGLVGLRVTIGQHPQALEHFALLRLGLEAPVLEAPRCLPRFEVRDVGEDHRHQHGRPLAPARSCDVDLAHAAHAVLVEIGANGGLRLRAAFERRQLVEKLVIVDAL